MINYNKEQLKKDQSDFDKVVDKVFEEHYPKPTENPYITQDTEIERELKRIYTTEFTRTGTSTTLIDPFYCAVADTGVKESDGKLDYELDWDFIKLMAEVMSKNKGKYPPYNWKKPMDIEKLKQALLRHTIAIMSGEYDDDGKELGHFASVALNAMMTAYQIKNK